MFILKLSEERNFTGKLDSFVGLEVKVKVTQSCLTLCDSTDYTVCGILQARILKWAAFLFSRESSQPRDRTQVLYIALEFNESLSNLDVPPQKFAFLPDSPVFT